MSSKLLRQQLAKNNFEAALIDEISMTGRLKKASAGESVIAPGMKATEIPFVLSGLLKIMREDKKGEIFLYYLEPGETCAMSITCCLENKKSAFRAISDEYSELWMIPVMPVNQWVKKYDSFRRFIFNAYQNRFDELLLAIDSMAFMKMDERLYKYLLDKKQASGSFEIHKTHEQIAQELNTSRVVISRLLKKLEREEKIEQHRNRIEIL